MTYAFTQDVPINVDVYQRIIQGLGDTPAEGFILHLAIELPGGGLRYIDVWESEAHWDRFAEDRLHPVINPLLQQMLGVVPPEPAKTPISIVDIWQGTTASRPVAVPAA